jgi:hypothetical protein
MLAIFYAYIDIALLRRGPQTMPPSPVLLLLTILALAALSAYPEPGVPFTMVQELVIFGLYCLMLCSVVWILLNAIRHSERFVQTMTAIFGAELILTLVKLGMLLMFGDAAEPPVIGEPLQTPHFVAFALEAWSLVVLSAILREALAISVLQSIGVIMLHMILFLGAASLVLPELAQSS